MCAIRKAPVVHISARLMAQRTQNTLVYGIRVSQGSAATRFGCGGSSMRVLSQTL